MIKLCHTLPHTPYCEFLGLIWKYLMGIIELLLPQLFKDLSNNTNYKWVAWAIIQKKHTNKINKLKSSVSYCCV